ncbi:MAG: GPW/gp25 family protein [Bryobacteraceae bacterium]|nr:GPW/gp25 family protein [Bryobacteraceae bacterium]
MPATLPPYLTGWPLLPTPDENGEINYPTPEQSVRHSIQIILRTRPGEQLMRPRFGAGLENFLHEPSNMTTWRRIRDLVFDSLTTWEPRIILDHVDVTEVVDQPTHLRVRIAYRMRRTGAPQQLSLTMQVQG